MKFLSLLAWVLGLLCTVDSYAFDVPRLRGPVNDYAQVLPRKSELVLSQVLRAAREQSQVELAVLVVDSLQGSDIESASIRVVDEWKLGDAKQDKGVLLFIAVKDKKLRIEVGQGLEGSLTDAKSNQIIEQVIVPRLKKGNFVDALMSGSLAILQVADPSLQVDSLLQGMGDRRSSSGSSFLQLILFFVFMILSLIFGGRSGLLFFLLGSSMGGRRGGFGGGGFGGGGFGGGGGFSGGGSSGGW